MPVQSRRKSRWRSGARRLTRLKPAGAVEPLVAMLHRPAGPMRPPVAGRADEVLERARRRSSACAKRKPCPRSQPRRCSVVALLGELDALGDDLERAASRRARRPPRRGRVVSGDAPARRNERSILRMSTGKPAEVAQRRVARAEVVHREPHAERLELLEAPHGEVGVGHHHRLGDLEHEATRRSRPDSARAPRGRRRRCRCAAAA